MNIPEEQISELKTLNSSYKKVHNNMNTLESKIAELVEEQKELSNTLKNLRDFELHLINKIEEDLGRKITADDIMKLLNE